MKNYLVNRISKKLVAAGLLLFATLFPTIAFAQLSTQGGGTGSTSPSGILYGVTGNLHLQTLKLGSGLTFSGTTLAVSGAASSTLLGDTNTFSGTDIFSNTIKVASLTGLIGGNSGTLYNISTSSPLNTAVTGNAGTATAFASTPTKCAAGNFPLGIDASGNAQNCTAAGTGTVTSVTATYPLASTGGATPNITTNFGTTTNNGMSAGFLYSGSGGIWQTGASSTLFGYTPLNPTRNINTTYPLQGGGDLSADRTLTTAFGTTTAWGLGNNGIVMTGAAGVPFSQATSSAIALSITGNAATVTTNANLSGVVTSSGNTTSFGSQSAGVLGNAITGNTQVLATSTLYGAVQAGKILAGANGALQYVATTTDSCSSGITCSFAGTAESFSIANNAITLAMMPTLGAGQIWANNTSATANAIAIATSTLFGAGLPGQVLMWSGSTPIWAATSTSNGVTSIATNNGLTGGTITTTGTIGLATIAQGWMGNTGAASAVPISNATTTLFSGSTGWNSYFSASGALVGTSSIFTATNSFVGVASTTPFSRFSVGTGLASSSITVAEYKYGTTGNVATSTTANIDCNASTQIAWPIGFSASTLTLINLIPGKKCIVVVQNPNGVAGAITWAVQGNAILKWAGGTVPTQTTTANTFDVWSFLATQGSSTMEIIGAATLNN